ncbi:MAG: glycosyltransferase [Patescibacteria group bacterium]
MKHFSFAKVAKQSIASYAQFSTSRYQQILKLGRQLAGTKIFHLNSVSATGGGGVAEIIKYQVPLERSLELDSRWLVISAPEQFFVVTKKIHNLLQGQSGTLSVKEKRLYLNHLHQISNELSKYLEKVKGRAIMVIHDPQPLPVIDYLPPSILAISRLHIDLSQPNRLMLDWLKPYLDKAQRVIISNSSFRPSWLPLKKTVISYPAINPFALKNRALKVGYARQLLKKIKVDIKRPILAQVSRFDPWKDPLGVVEAYYLAKKQIPGLQLILKGDIIAKDDPEAKIIFQRVKKECKGDPDIFVLADPNYPQNVTYGTFINAIQQGADVVVQKSIKEGFGLTCTEAMWKGQAVVAGNVGGLKIQITNGQNGFLVNSPTECAERITQLIKHPKLAKRLGKQAHKTVKDKYLIHALVEDHLKIYQTISGA